MEVLLSMPIRVAQVDNAELLLNDGADNLGPEHMSGE